MENYKYIGPPLHRKFKLYISALSQISFYKYGEIGNILYTVGKNILDGMILFTMFSMAEQELNVAAVLGVMIKYAYPMISLISSNLISGYIDHLESLKLKESQIAGLIQTQVRIGAGHSLAAVFLFLCFPPVFKYLFFETSVRAHIIIGLYLLHHIFDGTAQIVEGRTWFKIIEIKIRTNGTSGLSKNFWVIHTLSQNLQLLLGQFFLWAALGITSAFSDNLNSPIIILIICFGLFCVFISKFILPLTYKLDLCS